MPSKRKPAIKSIGLRTFRVAIAGVAVLLPGAMAASGQAAGQAPEKYHVGTPVIGITYDVERAQVASAGCCFWMRGASADLAVPLFKGLGIAASFGGAHVSNIRPGANLSKISYLAGPRYTFDTSNLAHAAHGPQIFGEALFGGVHGFDGTFPATGAVASTANSFAMQIGGGIDLILGRRFGLRMIEVDYVRTELPNAGTNTQNDLRLAFGVSYHFAPK
jgi:outer membrane immunogenic protein